MIFKRIKELVKIDFINGKILLLTYFLMTLFYSLFWGVLTRLIAMEQMYSISLLSLPLLASILSAFTLSLQNVTNDKKYQTGEMLLTTDLKASEYLLAKWLSGFLAGFCTCLITLSIFLLLTKSLYASQAKMIISSSSVFYSLIFS